MADIPGRAPLVWPELGILRGQECSRHTRSESPERETAKWGEEDVKSRRDVGEGELAGRESQEAN